MNHYGDYLMGIVPNNAEVSTKNNLVENKLKPIQTIVVVLASF
jgi:hypothetical protein